MVVYHENQHLQNVVNRPSAKQSMFLAWFEANKRFPEARTIKYADFPQHFVYSNESMSWEPRKKGFSIGRLNNVPPGKGEDYYLRLLLNIQAGCTSYEELRSMNMKVYDTFRDACYVLGLFQDDKEYIDDIKEVSRWASAYCTRLLFAIMLLANNLSRPEYVWEKCWSELSDDMNYRHQKRHNNPALTLSEDDLKNYALIEIEKILQSNGKSLRNYIAEQCIKQQSPQADLLIEAKLIIWDEAPMMHRFCFEALDRTMRSILNSEKPFGGKVIVLGGDFRQILPVVLKASRQDIVHATINSSPLWRECRVTRLHKNMRLQLNSSSSSEDEIREFAEWILRIGNGEAGDYNDGEASIEIPEDMLIRESEDAFSELLQFVYSDLLNNIANHDFIQGRAILGPTNESVIYVNDYMSSLIEELEKVYLSSDSLCMDEADSEINAEIYSTEFLNTISCSGLPPHELKLKKGVPVMLIRYIDQARGLCNGTRLQVERLGMHVISCKVLSGKNVGDMVNERCSPFDYLGHVAVTLGILYLCGLKDSWVAQLAFEQHHFGAVCGNANSIT
ncbi:PREDICTED: uncharacterized protein LOC105973151 [Erythranthe guttata]|uniref:uncharacterized protein LOC105973151 n=1 Tax=Erythranthe guttata TaxID=4155 RepID=UPI00064DB684|nr:PREDICTED: uncharacterized protein LOC105973151 [Erythranthe guttata]|eukprot:XP_012853625.1 PREDICTED: uncharacterized protein LOC105973151 [Erythranthe guttata]